MYVGQTTTGGLSTSAQSQVAAGSLAAYSGRRGWKEDAKATWDWVWDVGDRKGDPWANENPGNAIHKEMIGPDPLKPWFKRAGELIADAAGVNTIVNPEPRTGKLVPPGRKQPGVDMDPDTGYPIPGRESDPEPTRPAPFRHPNSGYNPRTDEMSGTARAEAGKAGNVFTDPRDGPVGRVYNDPRDGPSRPPLHNPGAAPGTNQPKAATLPGTAPPSIVRAGDVPKTTPVKRPGQSMPIDLGPPSQTVYDGSVVMGPTDDFGHGVGTQQTGLIDNDIATINAQAPGGNGQGLNGGSSDGTQMSSGTANTALGKQNSVITRPETEIKTTPVDPHLTVNADAFFSAYLGPDGSPPSEKQMQDNAPFAFLNEKASKELEFIRNVGEVPTEEEKKRIIADIEDRQPGSIGSYVTWLAYQAASGVGNLVGDFQNAAGNVLVAAGAAAAGYAVLKFMDKISAPNEERVMAQLRDSWRAEDTAWARAHPGADMEAIAARHAAELAQMRDDVMARLRARWAVEDAERQAAYQNDMNALEIQRNAINRPVPQPGSVLDIQPTHWASDYIGDFLAARGFGAAASKINVGPPEDYKSEADKYIPSEVAMEQWMLETLQGRNYITGENFRQSWPKEWDMMNYVQDSWVKSVLNGIAYRLDLENVPFDDQMAYDLNNHNVSPGMWVWASGTPDFRKEMTGIPYPHIGEDKFSDWGNQDPHVIGIGLAQLAHSQSVADKMDPDTVTKIFSMYSIWKDKLNNPDVDKQVHDLWLASQWLPENIYPSTDPTAARQPKTGRGGGFDNPRDDTAANQTDLSEYNDKQQADRDTLSSLRPFFPVMGTDFLDTTVEQDKLKEQNLMMGMSKPANWPLGNVDNPMWVNNLVNEGFRYMGPMALMPPIYQGGNLTDGATLYGSWVPTPTRLRQPNLQFTNRRLRTR